MKCKSESRRTGKRQAPVENARGRLGAPQPCCARRPLDRSHALRAGWAAFGGYRGEVSCPPGEKGLLTSACRGDVDRVAYTMLVITVQNAQQRSEHRFDAGEVLLGRHANPT